MTAATTSQLVHVLSRSDGVALLSAHEAILKGVLEAQVDVRLMTGPRTGAFAKLFGTATSPPAASTLREHGVRIIAAPDATRAITLAGQAAHSGHASIVMVPCDRLDGATPELSRINEDVLPRGAAMCVMLEDDPASSFASCPRKAAQRLEMPAIEVSNVEGLRDAIDHSLLLSRSGRCVVGLIAHASVLRSADTIDLRSNRVGSLVEVLRDRPRRRARARLSLETSGLTVGTTSGVLRSVRRLELNRFRALPSPGERVGFGFITVGPADESLMHLVDVLQLHGRVPVLHLQLITPVDDAAVGRVLLRCENVVVLEPRPGVLESEVLSIAEMLRRNDLDPAIVWGKSVPPKSGEPAAEPATLDVLHPSVLARRITHLLHEIRPSAQVASHLTPLPPATPPVPARESAIGSHAALQEVRRMLRDTDQWLRERAPLAERDIPATSLAIDGSESIGSSARRIVMVESWDHRRFLRCGAPAIVQAARDDRPWLIVACESEDEDVSDLERMARGVIPADRTDRVILESANLADPVTLREHLREAALRDGLTILIVRDGPPARFDIAAVDAATSEIDRLGFEPRQRIVESVEEICAIRSTFADDEHQQGHGSITGVKSETSIERVSDRITAKFRLRIKPMLEEAEVTRVRPPPLQRRGTSGLRFPTPDIIHANRPRWRAHLAGWRGDSPGSAALVLSEAGRTMNYHVRVVHDPAPIGPGRRAWSQVLFTRLREDDQESPVSTVIPFGEADLLLGFDARETIRAISPELHLRVASAGETHAVVNLAPFIDDHDFESPSPAPEQVAAAIGAVTHSSQCVLADFAGTCRIWFHTDRVCDMTMLGVAYQRGSIPVSAEAIEQGLAAAESRGFGRAREAFEFGRKLSLDQSLLNRTNHEASLPPFRMARRLALTMRDGLPGSTSRSRQMASLLRTSLEQMPGLAETDSGRQASRDFLMACHHCAVWGGLGYAETFADLITRLYQVDRGDTGRSLTRTAILPLAEALLIRDPLYVAGLAASGEHRRRVRARLHAKRSRGDEIERRYLTRIDILALGRRIRMDLRTSDWPMRLVSAGRRVVPSRFRGAKRERQLRDYMVELVRRAIVESPQEHERWASSMQRLHDQAVEGRLRGMAMAEVRMLTGIEDATRSVLPSP